MDVSETPDNHLERKPEVRLSRTWELRTGAEIGGDNMKGLLASGGRRGQHFPGTSPGCGLCWEQPADPGSSVLHPCLPTRGRGPLPSPDAHWCRPQGGEDGGIPDSRVVSMSAGLGSLGAQCRAEGSDLSSLNNLSLKWGSEGLRRRGSFVNPPRKGFQRETAAALSCGVASAPDGVGAGEPRVSPCSFPSHGHSHPQGPPPHTSCWRRRSNFCSVRKLPRPLPSQQTNHNGAQRCWRPLPPSSLLAKT